MKNTEKKSVSDYFGIVALKLGGQIHLRTLRDSFASIMPFMILAGFITFINYVIIKLMLEGGNGNEKVFKIIISIIISYSTCFIC